MRRWAAWLGPLLLLSGGAAFAQDGAQPMRDLRYGEALYHFYQEHYFSAISRLLTAEHTRPITAQGPEPELLLGGLYLSYGLHREAGGIFERLVDEHASPSARDRAWYYLGALRYRRGYYPQAVEAFERVGESLPPERAAERLHLLANAYLAQGEHDRAALILRQAAGESEWQAYAHYNLGVALIQSGRRADGLAWLQRVGRLRADSEEARMLRDKANLALGFALMSADSWGDALPYLERVRLHGPIANTAMLALGWAHSNNGDFEQALLPWQQLSSRAGRDAAVQEALLAVPYTLEQLNAEQAALRHYERAVAAYVQELRSLARARRAVQDPEFLRALQARSLGSEDAVFLTPDLLPDVGLAPHLAELFASKAFQEAYRGYLDLQHLQHTLAHWAGQVPAYGQMLDARRAGYQRNLARVSADPRLQALDGLQARYAQLQARVARLEAEEDPLALATAEEQARLARLEAVGARLARLAAAGQEVGEQQAKYRVLRGLLEWDVASEYGPRLWAVKKGLAETEQALAQSTAAHTSLARAWESAPTTFEGFDARIDQLDGRLVALSGRVDAALQAQETLLRSLAVAALETRRQRLEEYQLRARFALARLLDDLARRAREDT